MLRNVFIFQVRAYFVLEFNCISEGQQLHVDLQKKPTILAMCRFGNEKMWFPKKKIFIPDRM